ncbi:MAG: HAD family hydrolase [Candidatus Geothermarchaeales archaeon]
MAVHLRFLNRVSKDLVYLWEKELQDVLFPDVRPCLETLRDEGYEMAVISQNLWPSEYQEEHFKVLDILDFFELVLTSESAGYDKPDPRLFAKGLNTLEVSPGEAVYVAGISPLLFVQSPLAIGQITGFIPANLE